MRPIPLPQTLGIANRASSALVFAPVLMGHSPCVHVCVYVSAFFIFNLICFLQLSHYVAYTGPESLGKGVLLLQPLYS